MKFGHIPGNSVLVCLMVALCSAVGPPIIKGTYQATQITKVGQAKKRFTCPVEADPLPIIQWFKDGESISEIWPRYHITQEGILRIKDIEQDDAGKFQCKATNGFGSISIDYSLIVVVKNSTDNIVKHEDVANEQHPDEDLKQDGVKPHFIEVKKMEKSSNIVRPVGSSVRLRCRASGQPVPGIHWTKDNQESVRMSDTEEGGHRWTLKIKNLQESDAGRYQCIVTNKHGVVNFTYTLEVIAKLMNKPVLIGPHPKNETVVLGGLASFQCKVKSTVQPHIQWLKRLDKGMELPEQNSSVIEVKGQRFLVLKTGPLWKDSEGFYLNKFVIKNVILEDVGMYICLGANSMGYNFRSAYLSLHSSDGIDETLTAVRTISPSLSDRTSSEPVGNGSLPFIIAIPAGVAIVLVTLAIVILKRRKGCNIQSNVRRNTRFNAVPTHENFQPPVQPNPYIIPQKASGQSSSSRSTDRVSKTHNIDVYSDISSVARCQHHQSLNHQYAY